MADLNESLHRIRAVIFDADGTLVDSTPMWNRIDYDYADFKGIDVPPDINKIMNELGTLRQCAAYFRERLGVAGSVEEIMAEITHMAEEKYRTTVPEIEGAAAFLQALRARGIHTALATATDLHTLTPALERLGLAENLEIAESCVTIGKSKKHPDIYIKCAADFGAKPEECVVFEDALYAARTAKEAGFSVVGVLSAEMTDSERAEFFTICDRCVENFTVLLGELLPPEDR